MGDADVYERFKVRHHQEHGGEFEDCPSSMCQRVLDKMTDPTRNGKGASE